MAGIAAVAAVLAFIVVVAAGLATLAAVVAAVVGYLKRDAWTLPVYRKARERTGRWSVTPWSGGEAQPQENPEAMPVEAPTRIRRPPKAA